MNPTDLDETLREKTSASTGQLLLRAARLLDERALARLATIPGAPPVRPAHTRLFPHLSFTGTRLTTLARRLGVSKQAVAPLVTELVMWGLVEQLPDPSDRRASLVRFTPDGLAALTHGLGLLGELEAEISAEVGAERAAVFREVLEVWVKVLSRA
jgi:DNA-binding MarR family transcriptional regulator